MVRRVAPRSFDFAQDDKVSKGISYASREMTEVRLKLA
jgi:hypothetical protein